MTVEDKRSANALTDEEGFNDQFPVGMRVLAVDDDPICLKVLETLLRKCQYNVTTTNQAVKALQMLRENRNNYDLVISDVNMPDIDGFKLLEHVGLEMDLPVIMLSAHGDTKLVMKGITHGACDYLLKPVRIEELRNIWQHVIRRKKLDPKDRSKSANQDKSGCGAGEGGQGPNSSGNTDQNGKANRKRKDQNEDDEEEDEENGHDNEDPGTQKKPRVVWSVELHRKFVAAVNQLGLDKAVPKKILDLMNVEGLTRENVASHLQKYRLYLKRISNVASQQANLVAQLGNKDSSYLRIGLDGFNDFRSLAGAGRFSSSPLSSYPPGGMLGRLNSPATLSLRGITSSGMIQPGHSQNFCNSVNTKLQPAGLLADKTSNLFQGVPTSLELNQLQQSKGINTIRGYSPLESTGFTGSTSFPDTRVGLGSSSNSVNSGPNNPLLLQGNPQQTQNRALLCNQSSLRMASSNPDSFEIGVNGSSNFLDHGRCNDSWQSAVQLSKFSSSPLSEQLPLNNYGENASSTGSQAQSTPIDFSSSGAAAQAAGSSRDMESQAALMGNIMSYPPEQRWDEHRQNYSSINPLSSANGIADPLHHSMDQNNAISIENIDMSFIGQLHGGTSLVQQGEVRDDTRSNANFLLDQTRSQDGFIQNNYDSLDDLMSALVKKEQHDGILMDGELGFDPYSLGSCM